MSIDAPTATDSYVTLTDWLELMALFSSDGVVKLDGVVSAFEIGADAYSKNIGDADIETEDQLSCLTEEVARRLDALTAVSYTHLTLPTICSV